MPKKKINYTEGTCFLVPLRKGGYARGVVTRLNAKGTIFGYFFGPKFAKTKDATLDFTLRPQNNILLAKLGDLGLLKGEWPVIGRIEPWIRTEWPLPPFFRTDALGQLGYVSYYDDKSLRFVKEEKVKIGEIDASKFPDDSLWGYGAIEIRLTKLLA
jgi:Immunity protein 26